MKKIISVFLVITIFSALFTLCVGASDAQYYPKTTQHTSELVAGCGTIGAYDEASKSITIGADANGDNYATTGVYIPAGTRATVSLNIKFNGFRNGMGGGLFFDPRANIADRNGVGGGTGFMTWTGDGFAQVKTWSWNTDFTPVEGDAWFDGSSVLNTSDVSVVYTIIADFYEDNTIKITFKNNTTGNSMVFKDAPVAFTNNHGVYVGAFMLNGSATISELCVTNYLPIYDSTYLPVCGNWSYDEATNMLKGGISGVGDNYAGTDYYIAPGERVTVSVDIKFDAFTNGCGAGLFFDAFSKEERLGLGSGMGVLTWMGTDFTQFKTWNWNGNVLGTDTDYWNPITNLTLNDSEIVYTIIADFFEDGTAQFSITNKTTKETYILQNDKLAFKNTSGVYVGVVILNTAASFSNLNVDYHGNNPSTFDKTASMILGGIVIAFASVWAGKKKKKQ